jgi:hypothetical protein
LAPAVDKLSEAPHSFVAIKPDRNFISARFEKRKDTSLVAWFSNADNGGSILHHSNLTTLRRTPSLRNGPLGRAFAAGSELHHASITLQSDLSHVKRSGVVRPSVIIWLNRTVSTHSILTIARAFLNLTALAALGEELDCLRLSQALFDRSARMAS